MANQKLTRSEIDQKIDLIFRDEKELLKLTKIIKQDRSTSKIVSIALPKILVILNGHNPLPDFIAQVKNYWIPIANNFGMWKMRYLLEDKIFELTDKKTYRLVSSLVKKKQKIHQMLFANIVEIVSYQMKKAGLKNFEIVFRQKNIYGIHKKMERKHGNINFMTDWFGVRIIVETVPQCYKVLEILHYLWPYYRHQFKDYIENPKMNNYQSIHTILHCLDRQTVEFQIRTYKMDVIAKYGLAAHALYKRDIF